MKYRTPLIIFTTLYALCIDAQAHEYTVKGLHKMTQERVVANLVEINSIGGLYGKVWTRKGYEHVNATWMGLGIIESEKYVFEVEE